MDESDRLPDAEAVLGSFTGFPITGADLWQQNRDRVQAGDLDDRPLYWQRLKMRKTTPHFETTSRNYNACFSDEADCRILVTGFDPFNLDDHIDQSNPSGIVALSFDDTWVESGSSRIHFRSLIVPVRFRDFDEGLIEDLVATHLNSMDMMVTVSMGRDAFDLERFPGLRRSSGKPDNERRLCGGTQGSPVIPQGLTGPEFVEYSLPAEIQSARGEYPINDNGTVTTLEKGEISTHNPLDLHGLTAVNGSGGGYLSNEISYRAIRAIDDRVPVGHIHTPRYAGFDSRSIAGIVDQTRMMIIAAAVTVSADPV